ncbi:hypothetical protein [Chromobacterium phragmitis]|uniref:hypothetical protein n=1 Tax=Chromobacterium phragmitis TaxID=2202141 RepID=UPI001E2E3261|nr:hypothetical protein [Chromobacterium phragmitis]
MADQTLSPALRQTAEQYLGRPLEAQEEQQLLLLQQNIQSQQPALSGAVQQARQQQNTLAMAAANQGVMQIYSLNTMAGAAATEKVAQGGIADNLTSLLTVLQSFINR